MSRLFSLATALLLLIACSAEKPAQPDAENPSETASKNSSVTDNTPATRERLEASIDIPANDPAIAGLPKAVISTSMGDITVVLYPAQAPKSVANFEGYVGGRHYNRTIFHRVIPGFMIQGGGFSNYLEERRTGAPIPYEGENGLNNERGTLAMARTQDPNSATAQWYINLEDNDFLDHHFKPGQPGYTVFGRVISGMNIVDEIAIVPTSTQVSGAGQTLENVPVDPVVIEGVEMK